MGKSVYSLALNDEIIAEIDRLAYQNGTNRSGLINSILAEYLQFTTPEQRMREVFGRMEKLLLSTEAEHPAFQLLSLPSDTMFNLRSAIRYKYNPTARYSVELYRQPEDGVFGELRVSIRTQNRNLIEAMKQFYELWTEVEREHREVESSVDEQGRISRKLRLSFRDEQGGEVSGLTVGDVLSQYITTFDRGLKAYFDCLQQDDVTRDGVIAELEEIYSKYLQGEVQL